MAIQHGVKIYNLVVNVFDTSSGKFIERTRFISITLNLHQEFKNYEVCDRKIALLPHMQE